MENIINFEKITTPEDDVVYSVDLYNSDYDDEYPVTNYQTNSYNTTQIAPVGGAKMATQNYTPAYMPGMQIATDSTKNKLEDMTLVIDTHVPFGNFNKAPGLYLIEQKINRTNEIGEDACAGTINRQKYTQNYKAKLIAELFFSHVIEFDDFYLSDILHRDASGAIVTSECKISKEACINKDIRKELELQGITCFDVSTNEKTVSNCIYPILKRKASNGYELPKFSGFADVNSKYCFVSVETCIRNNIPTTIPFFFDTEPKLLPDQINSRFIALSQEHKNQQIFIFLNLLRIMGLICTPLYEAKILMRKLSIIQGNAEDIALYIQIYNREYSFEDAISINEPLSRLFSVFEEQKDCVVLLTDEKDITKKKAENGVVNIKSLRKTFIKQAELSPTFSIIPAIISYRLSQYISGKEAVIFNAEKLRDGVNTSDGDTVKILYEVDKVIVNWFIEYHSLAIKALSNDYNKFLNSDIDFTYSQTKEAFAAIMTVFYVLQKSIVCNESNAFFESLKMQDFIIEMLQNSEKINNYNSAVNEFVELLNNKIISEEYDFICNSELYQNREDTGKPLIYTTKETVLVPDDVMINLVEQLHQTVSDCILRKYLSEAKILVNNENLKYKTTIYGSIKERVTLTAIRVSIISKEAYSHLKGNECNYEYSNNSNGIMIGTDWNNKPVYWSINHDDLSARHLLIIGATGQGKSFAINHIAKQLYENGHTVVYVNYKQQDVKAELSKHGFGREYFKKNVVDFKIDNINTGVLKIPSIFSENRGKIIAFTAESYSEEIEIFLSNIYKYVSNTQELNIFLIIDEVQCLEFKKNTALYNIMSMGRGVGISLISSFHSFREMKKSQTDLLCQAPVKLIFKMANDYDTEKVAKTECIKPYCLFEKYIMGLKKKQCIMVGTLENSYCEIEPSCFTKLTIPTIE